MIFKEFTCKLSSSLVGAITKLTAEARVIADAIRAYARRLGVAPCAIDYVVR